MNMIVPSGSPLRRISRLQIDVITVSQRIMNIIILLLASLMEDQCAERQHQYEARRGLERAAEGEAAGGASAEQDTQHSAASAVR